MRKLTSYLTPAGRREHGRADLGHQPLDARLLADPGVRAGDRYCHCQLLNLSYAGRCLHGEDLLETGKQYQFILDVSAMLGAEVEVAARTVWKRADAGLCYAGAVFVKGSTPWLGPDYEDGRPRALGDNGRQV